MGAVLIGQKFGRLEVVEKHLRSHKSGPRGSVWLCRCDCGEYCLVRGKSLMSGHTKSCGCLHRELSAERMAKMNFKHGKSNTRLYSIWSDMKKRCDNRNHWAFCGYGGRGITYSKEWSSFVPFEEWANKNGYSDRLTLDRIDNDGNYSPANCRWVDRTAQANNRRSSIRYEYRGESHTLPEFSRIYSIELSTLRGRIYRGWDIAKAIEVPVREVRRHGT